METKKEVSPRAVRRSLGTSKFICNTIVFNETSGNYLRTSLFLTMYLIISTVPIKTSFFNNLSNAKLLNLRMKEEKTIF